METFTFTVQLPESCDICDAEPIGAGFSYEADVEYVNYVCGAKVKRFKEQIKIEKDCPRVW